jgi:hypothetical protein
MLLLLQFGGVDLDPASSTLWFAGKQLLPDKPLSEYMGRNERTRAVVKLQKKGQGPPAREPVRDGAFKHLLAPGKHLQLLQ